MKIKLLPFILLFVHFANAQFHDNNIPKITSVEEAESYAGRYREVSVGFVDLESDTFLFDSVDVNDMKSSVGKMQTLFGRRTKFLVDTAVTMVSLQIVSFDFNLISVDSANVLINEITDRINGGESYWKLMREYRSKSCKFYGGPYRTMDLKDEYGSTFENSTKGEIIITNNKVAPEHPILIMIGKEAHRVPAFYSISYNLAG